MRLTLILPLLLLGLFSGCTALKPGCFIQDKLSAVATDVVVSKLQCMNSFAVKADMDALVKVLGVCKETKKTGPIADAVCPLVVDSVVNKLIGAAIPAEWQCSAENAKATVRAALSYACKQIPVSQWAPPLVGSQDLR